MWDFTLITFSVTLTQIIKYSIWEWIGYKHDYERITLLKLIVSGQLWWYFHVIVYNIRLLVFDWHSLVFIFGGTKTIFFKNKQITLNTLTQLLSNLLKLQFVVFILIRSGFLSLIFTSTRNQKDKKKLNNLNKLLWKRTRYLLCDAMLHRIWQKKRSCKVIKQLIGISNTKIDRKRRTIISVWRKFNEQWTEHTYF